MIESNVTMNYFLGERLNDPSREVIDREYKASYRYPLPSSVDAFITSDLSKGIVRSWKPDCPVGKGDLAYLQLTHWNFEKKVAVGELVVNKSAIEDVTSIFAEIFRGQFPIEKMRLIDNYDADDDRSMNDNNSSAFCSRDITGRPGEFSIHSYGLAIDLNPRQNPYYNYEKSIIAPLAGAAYLDRDQEALGMIKKGDVCERAFSSRGFLWGGDWEGLEQYKGRIDYQHFDKHL